MHMSTNIHVYKYTLHVCIPFCLLCCTTSNRLAFLNFIDMEANALHWQHYFS